MAGYDLLLCAKALELAGISPEQVQNDVHCVEKLTDLGRTTDIGLAVRFHKVYERLAPEYGYETRKETREFDPNTPNGRLMIATCGQLLGGARR